MNAFQHTLDLYFKSTNKAFDTPKNINDWLGRQNIMHQSDTRPGRELRRLLQAGKITHAVKPDGIHWLLYPSCGTPPKNGHDFLKKITGGVVSKNPVVTAKTRLQKQVDQVISVK